MPVHSNPVRWAVAAPFFAPGAANRWLADRVPADRHCLIPVELDVAPATVRGDGTATTTQGWKAAWQQVGKAFALRPDGMITLFPPLPTLAGVRRRMTRGRFPIVAWCFNLGQLYGGMKRHLARFGLGAVDRIICHSRFEIEQYSRWLGLPPERFRFVPLQRGQLVQRRTAEDNERPFVVAMGSARRDYATFIRAVERLRLRTVVIADPHATEGLHVPSNVEVRHGLSRDECYVLCQQARVNVIPIRNEQTASGQVSVVQAMHLGRAVVATDCPGTRDYIVPGQNGLVVPPADTDAMAEAIDHLWHDANERQRLGSAAEKFAQTHLSDEAAGRHLTQVLDEVLAGR